MTPEDKIEFKEILHDYIAGVIAKQEARGDIIEYKLDYIKDESIKYNNRISEVEKVVAEMQKHPFSCSLAGKVRTLEDTVLTQKSVRNWIITAIAVTSGFLGLIVLFLQLAGVFH